MIRKPAFNKGDKVLIVGPKPLPSMVGKMHVKVNGGHWGQTMTAAIGKMATISLVVEDAHLVYKDVSAQTVYFLRETGGYFVEEWLTPMPGSTAQPASFGYCVHCGGWGKHRLGCPTTRVPGTGA